MLGWLGEAWLWGGRYFVIVFNCDFIYALCYFVFDGKCDLWIINVILIILVYLNIDFNENKTLKIDINYNEIFKCSEEENIKATKKEK